MIRPGSQQTKRRFIAVWKAKWKNKCLELREAGFRLSNQQHFASSHDELLLNLEVLDAEDDGRDICFGDSKFWFSVINLESTKEPLLQQFVSENSVPDDLKPLLRYYHSFQT